MLFEVFQLKTSYGKLICRQRRTKVSNKKEASKGKVNYDAFQCIFDPDSTCCEEDSMDDKDLDYQLPLDLTIGEEKLNGQIRTLNSFLAACGSKRKVSVTMSYTDLSHRVNLRRISLGQIIMQSVTSLIASPNANSLMHDSYRHMKHEEPNIILDGNFRPIRSGIPETYTEA